MEVRVSSLGAIKEATVQLKPLTVFIGPNNSGKTWLAYTLATALDSYGWDRYLDSCDIEKLSESYPTLVEFIQEVIEQGNGKLDIIRFAEQNGPKYFEEIFCLARRWLPKAFGTKKASFENLEIRIDLADSKARFLENIKEAALERRLSLNKRTQEALINIVKEKNDSEIYIYAEANAFEKFPLEGIKKFIFRIVFGVLHRALYPNVYVLPTERTNIITASFSKRVTRTNTRKSANRDLEELENHIVPHPIANLVHLMLVKVRDTSLEERTESAKKIPSIAKYLQLAKDLEEKILAGEIEVSNPDNITDTNFSFQQQGINLEMTVASSMVKELAPLVLYLRYAAEIGDLLIIDEPEMNLHPLAQVRLTELLAMLVNFGIPVLITTHSPYIVDHLVNLMKAYESQNQAEIAPKFFLKQKEAFISKEKLSIQLFENGTARNILKEDGLIDWGTFGDVSEQINNIYFEI